jgi:hypothetical protein
MTTIFSRNQLVVAFSVVLFLLLVVVSASAFSGSSVTLPQTMYLLGAAVLAFLVLSLALIVHLILQRSK